jgi:5-oxopent-3-ene-1,2,5-tricarboxylate decarboxylase / 2-hydroxyhepta-2,4-diene-1,7-dioate isomerase
VYHRASHAATYGRVHMPLEHQIPIACAGVTVMPGDVVVGDGEGAVVIPAALVEEVAADAYQQELEEEWALGRVAAGESTNGVFPISAERRPEFEAWLADRKEPT